MTASASATVIHNPHLTFMERLAAWLACGLSVWLFLEMGGPFLRPADPLGPITLLTSRSSIMMLLGSAALLCAAAVVGSLLAGRRLMDVGLFAGALGLGVASLRGDTAEFFTLEGAELFGDGGRTLALRFAGEAVAWSIVVAAGAFISAILLTRLFRPAEVSAEADFVPPIPAGADVPGVVSAPAWLGTAGRTPLSLGLQHAAIVAGAGLVVFTVLSAGATIRSIQHGQVVFTVAAAVAAGAYVAHHVAPVRSALWSLLGMAAMALAGYLWASIRSNGEGLPPTVPVSPFLRVLPVQFIMIGTCSAVIMFWYMYNPPHLDRSTSAPKPGSPRIG